MSEQTTEMVNGRPAAKGWGEKLAKEQRVTHLQMKDGSLKPRVPYGDEKRYGRLLDTTIPCHDCNAVAGQIHVHGCDMEECPICHGQVFICDCPIQAYVETKTASVRYPYAEAFVSFQRSLERLTSTARMFEKTKTPKAREKHHQATVDCLVIYNRLLDQLQKRGITPE